MRLFPKLLLSFLAVALTGVLVVAFLANLTAAREVRQFMFSGGMVPEQALAQGLAGYYRGHGSWQGVENLLPPGPGRGPMGLGMMGRRFILVDSRNHVIADSTGLALGQTFSANAADSVVPVEVDSVQVGTLIAQGQPTVATGPSTDLLVRVNRGIWVAAFVAGLVALVMAGGLAYNLVRPIQQVTEAAGVLARGDLSRRVAVRAGGEIGKLATAFNAMAADLEKAERLRRDMTADVAHELRNPLAVLQGSLEAVVDGVLPPTPENLQPLLEQTGLLTRLVEDLRTLSLADAGQLRLDAAPVDPAALMQSIMGQFGEQARAKNVTLRADLGARLPAVTLDPQRMTQVLGNLLSNALRHSPSGEEIVCRVTASPAGVAFAVEDHGPGIPAETLPHLFERFHRTEAPSHGGTGLGLTIAKQLVELHGGQIAVASEVNRGTVVSVTLPAG